MSTMAYSQIAMNMGPDSQVWVAGIGVDGDTYVIAYIDTSGVWHPCEPRRSYPVVVSSSPVRMTQLVTGLNMGSTTTLQVVTLDGSGNVYVPCYQDGSGTWQTGGGQLQINSSGGTVSQIAAGAGWDTSGTALQIIGAGSENPVAAAYLDRISGWTAGSGTLASSAYSPVAAQGGSYFALYVLSLSGGKVYAVNYLTSQGDWSGAASSVTQLTPPSGTSYQSLFAGPDNTMYMAVFCLDNNGAPYLATYQDTSGTWNQGQALSPPVGTSFTQLVSAWGGDGTLQVVGLGTDGKPYVVGWTRSSTYTWNAGSTFYSGARSFTQLVMAQDAERRLQVVGLTAGDAEPHPVGTYMPVKDQFQWVSL